MTTSQLTYGTTEVTVKKKTHTLTPTLAAVNAIEQQYGGLRSCLNALNDFSLNAAVLVISAGANLKPKQVEKLRGDVFEHGSPDVCIQVIPYVASLFNPTGKKADDEEEEEEEEEGEEGE